MFKRRYVKLKDLIKACSKEQEEIGELVKRQKEDTDKLTELLTELKNSCEKED